MNPLERDPEQVNAGLREDLATVRASLLQVQNYLNEQRKQLDDQMTRLLALCAQATEMANKASTIQQTQMQLQEERLKVQTLAIELTSKTNAIQQAQFQVQEERVKLQTLAAELSAKVAQIQQSQIQLQEEHRLLQMGRLNMLQAQIQQQMPMQSMPPMMPSVFSAPAAPPPPGPAPAPSPDPPAPAPAPEGGDSAPVWGSALKRPPRPQP